MIFGELEVEEELKKETPQKRPLGRDEIYLPNY